MKFVLTVNLLFVLFVPMSMSLIKYLPDLFTEDTPRCSRIVCYYLKQLNGEFLKSDLKPGLCTHYIISGYSVNKNFDITTEISYWDEDPIEVFVKFKETHNVKILIAIQNDELFDVFVAMYKSESSRKIFVKNLVRLLYEKKLDGVKIDEQIHPGGDRDLFTKFISYISHEFCKLKKNGKPELILSVGIPSDLSFIEKYYDIDSLSDDTDMMDLATYKFKITDNTFYPQHHSPMETATVNNPNTMKYVSHYVAGRINHPGRLNIGLSTMNYVYLAPKARQFIFQNIQTFQERCHRMYTKQYKSWMNLDKEMGTSMTYRESRRNYYQVYYDSPQNLIDKVKSLHLYGGFRGIVVMALNYDDLRGGQCYNGKPYPLISAIADTCGTFT